MTDDGPDAEADHRYHASWAAAQRAVAEATARGGREWTRDELYDRWSDQHDRWSDQHDRRGVVGC